MSKSIIMSNEKFMLQSEAGLEPPGAAPSSLAYISMPIRACTPDAK